jgi:hypothetical protein
MPKYSGRTSVERSSIVFVDDLINASTGGYLLRIPACGKKKKRKEESQTHANIC